MLKTIIEKCEADTLNAYIAMDKDGALAADKSAAGTLKGLALAVKDNICVQGFNMTCASKMLEGYRPLIESEAVSRLKAQGAVVVGKTNLDEFAMGTTSSTGVFGRVCHPDNPALTTGGSSGGSAAAVAAGLCDAALGTDTGGSVRNPAALCGVTGFKPTYGLVSRHGVTQLAASMDCIGVLAKDVKTVCRVLSVMAGHDDKDALTVPQKRFDFSPAADGLKNKRIGVVKEWFPDFTQQDVKTATEKTLKNAERLGAELVPVSLPLLSSALNMYNVLCCAEAATAMSRFDGIRFGHRAQSAADLNELFVASRSEGFGKEVKRRILFGNLMLTGEHYSQYYVKAQRLRAALIAGISALLKDCDYLAGPTVPFTAFSVESANETQRTKGDYGTAAASLAGLPAVSVPCGTDANGLPVGLQLVGKALCDGAVLNAAYALESARGVL